MMFGFIKYIETIKTWNGKFLYRVKRKTFDGREYESEISPEQFKLIEFINNLNLSQNTNKELSQLIEDYGLSQYCEGSDSNFLD